MHARVVLQFGRRTLHKLRKNILRHMAPSSAADTAAGLNGSSLDSDDEAAEVSFEGVGGWYSNSCGSSSSSSSDGEADGVHVHRTTDTQQQQQDDEEARQRVRKGAGAAAAAFQGVGMVYGGLPPESRRTQAALFNAWASDWPRTSVLVASDAVGMGLNLNIRRWGGARRGGGVQGRERRRRRRAH